MQSAVLNHPAIDLRCALPGPGALPGGSALLAGARGDRLAAFSRAFGLVVACELWSEVARVPDMWHGARVAVAIAFTLAAAAIWARRWERAGAAAAAVILCLRLVCFFPLSANHYYLEVLIAVFLSLAGPSAEDEDLAVGALRWMAIVGLLAAGLQKVCHGYYFRGEFFSYMIAHDPRFSLLGWLVPAEELHRLQSLDRAVGAGPYRTESVLLILVSNLAYVTELLVPAGLLIRRTRAAALVAGILLIAAIEIVALELFFGLLMINILLLFGEGSLHRRCLPLFVMGGLYLLATSLGLLPAWQFT